MDLPPPVQDPDRREETDEVTRRLVAVEAAVIALGARLEQLEASLGQAVREETHRASNEIRHTVSELGRRLALDLPQFLDRHRQLIVGELRAAVSGAGAGAAAAGDGIEGSAGDGLGAPAAAATAPPPAAAASTTDDGDDEMSDDGGGRRKRRRRKEG